MTPDGSLYPSSADMSPTALIFLPDTSLMGNGCGKHAGMNSIYSPSHNAVRENMGFAPSVVVDCVLQLHDIATTLVQDFSSLHDHRLCSTYEQVQKFGCSSAVAQSADFIQFAVDDIDKNLSFLDALTHSKEWMILQTFHRVGPHLG